MVGGKSSCHLVFPNPLRYTTGFYRLIPLQNKYSQNNLCESFWLLLGELPYDSDGNARRKIQIKPLRETNVDVAQAYTDP